MYFRISYKLAFILLFSATVSMLLLGGIYHNKSQETIKTLVKSHLSLVAKQIRIQVDRYVGTQIDRINLISSRTQLRISLDHFLNSPNSTQHLIKINKILADAQRAIPDITSIMIYDLNGRLVSSTSPANQKLDPEKFKMNDPDFLDRVYVHLENGVSRLRINSALILDGKTIGMIIMELDDSGLEQSLFSKSSEIRPEKAILFYRNKPDVFIPILNHQRISYGENESNFIISHFDKSGSKDVIEIPLLGKYFLGYSVNLNEDNWRLVLIIDIDLAFRSLNAQNRFLIISTIIVLAVLLILSFFVGNRISKPIVDMAYVARLISEGDFSRRIKSYTNDEIGILGKTLNKMAERLIKANKELDKKVKLKTRNLEKANEKLVQLNHQISEQSKTDPLTRIKNRRAFDEYIDSEVKRANRDRLPISILLIDIDHFKAFNDTLGHQRGDECLIKVAQSLNASVNRESDMVARYGGEEFSAILPNTDATSAYAIAKKMLLELEVLNLTHPSSTTANNVTVSIGISSGLASNTLTLDSAKLIEQADQALYKAKENGRNQAIHHDNG